jgi:hypothetical protein
MMKQETERLSLATFIAAIGVAGVLCLSLAWLLSVSQFVTDPECPPLAPPLISRYEQFLIAVFSDMLVPIVGVAIVILTTWRRSRLICGTLGSLLLHRLLVSHIVFVLVNSNFRN